MNELYSKEATGSTHKIETGCGNLYVTVNKNPKRPEQYEILAYMGKAGGCAASQAEAISRLSTYILKNGGTIEDVAKELVGIRCPCPLTEHNKVALSCPDAIGKLLERYSNSKSEESVVKDSHDKKVTSSTHRVKIGCGYIYVTVAEYPKEKYDISSLIGKGGGCSTAQAEAISGLVNLALKIGNIEDVVEELKGIKCPNPIIEGNNMVLSCPDAIAKLLEDYSKCK